MSNKSCGTWCRHNYAPTEEKETGITCFICGLRSGIDCPGRDIGESTLCTPCVTVAMLLAEYEQAKHLLGMLNSGEITLEQFYEFI